jgi:hypothetical protein
MLLIEDVEPGRLKKILVIKKSSNKRVGKSENSRQFFLTNKKS